MHLGAILRLRRYSTVEHLTDWEKLTTEEKNTRLFWEQKRTLDLFLERNAISKSQYDKSLRDLKEKMKIRDIQA